VAAGDPPGIASITVTPSAAADAYRRAAAGDGAGEAAGGFGAVLQRAIQGAVVKSHDTDAKANARHTRESKHTKLFGCIWRGERYQE